jgi:hypothetical protein
MSFAMGLFLAYLKVAVLAAAILVVLWAAGKGFQALYNWGEKTTAAEPRAGETTAVDDSAKDGKP